MSSNTPFDPEDGPEGGLDRSAAGHPEYLGSRAPVESAPPRVAGSRWPVLGAVALGVAAVVGLGGWGAFALLSGGGTQPADALPSTAVAYASLDLDPSAAQKIEAFRILHRFPGIDEALDISGTEDLRRVVFEGVQGEGGCTGLDYADDIEPWIGDRVALAAVPDDTNGTEGLDAPVLALQVRDRDAAARGIRALAECADAGEHVGFAFSDDYVLLTDSQRRAESLVADADAGSLADDDAFREWTGEVGDPGILTVYAAPGAPAYFAGLRDHMGGGWSAVAPRGAHTGLATASGSGPTSEQMRSLSRDFQGMAVAVRFDDGAVEAELAGRGVPAGIGSAEDATGPDATGPDATGPDATGLPAGTAAALAFALPDGWFDTYFESMSAMGGMPVDEMLTAAEAETGLDLPGDIETLLGDGVSLSVDGTLDLDAMMKNQDPAQLPVGLRVTGDPARILPVVDKLKASIGPDADMVVVEPGDGVVGFGLNRDYVETLLARGALGEEESFRRAVPDAEKAAAVLYVDFDAGGGWAERLARSVAGLADGPSRTPGDAAAENVAPLDALGLSTWVDGDVQRGVFRLSTD